MCGIGGAIGRRDDRTAGTFAGRCLVENARRGPDYRAEHTLESGDWGVHLAHNRLTILDLTAAGHQPMTGGDGALWVTFNGEIYNYRELRTELEALGRRFHSASDTEVLLAAFAEWGTSAFERLNGMFALALVDLARRRLFLLRDRFGVKPLHYHAASDRLLFASTARPIAEVVGKEPDPAYLVRGARFGLFDDDSARTQYRTVRAVRPGHFVEVSLDGPALLVQERPFYSLADRVRTLLPELDGLERAAAVADCRTRLTHAIALRLRADVPVALSLSGGVDSATIAALAREQHAGIVGFSYGDPGRPETEGPTIARIVQRLGIGVQYVHPGPREMADLFWECLDQQDAPFTTGAIVAQFAVFRAVRAAGVKVLLGGQGGDEIFMGYRKYLAWRLLEAVRRGAPLATLGAFADVARALWAQRLQSGTYLRAAKRHARGGTADSLLQLAGQPANPYASSELQGLTGRQIADMTTGGLPTLLRYEDRSSMANSVESRLPFLDFRLVEWAIAAPVSTKLAGGYGKWVLRQVASESLPGEVTADRGKRGFDVRIEEWVAAGLGVEMRAELARHWGLIAGYFVPGTRCDEAFADRALVSAPSRFADAVTALWVGRCLS